MLSLLVIPGLTGNLAALVLPDLGAWGLWGLFVGTFLAVTVVPFSSDILYVAMLNMTSNPWACLAVASAGNWLGSLTSFGLGWLGRWEWIEKWFKVDRAKLEKQKVYVDKYGVWLALVSWLPFVGDLFSIALGFYKTNPWLTALLLLVGKTLRFLFWNLILGAY